MPMPRSETAGLGVVLYLAGVGFFALNDAIGKWLVADYGVGQLMLLRSIGAGVVLAPMILSLRVNFVDPRRPWLQVLRVLSAAVDTFAFYYATRYMPLADVMTFYMATPLITTALSALLLGEKVERFRWIAVLIGFAGVLIALRPSSHMFSHAAPIALFGATTFALSQTLTRELRGIHWMPLVLWQFIGTGLVGRPRFPGHGPRPVFLISDSCFWSASWRWSASSSSSGPWHWQALRFSRRCNIRRFYGRQSWAG